MGIDWPAVARALQDLERNGVRLTAEIFQQIVEHCTRGREADDALLAVAQTRC